MMTGRKSVAIIGGGLAGLAAGVALADAGLDVTLFERRPYLGGRASSYQHPGAAETIDNCQHVLLGCCTNLHDFYRRIGVDGRIRWYDSLTFIEPGGRESKIAASSVPAPFQTSPTFLRAHALSLRDKLGIARAMLPLLTSLPDESDNFASWLRRTGQTQRAIDRFWQPVLVSALNEELDRVSARSAGFVFREAFLKSARAGEMGVATVPLTHLYAAAGDFITAHNGQLHLRTSVEAVIPAHDRVRVRIPDGEITSDYAIVAVPWHSVTQLLPEHASINELSAKLAKLVGAPITGIHLWFDRELTTLDHAVLLDRTVQWMFHKSRIHGRPGSPSYIELVVSASKSLIALSRQEIIDLAVRELADFFPIVRDAQLVKATVVKEVNATFAPAPHSDALRPTPVSPWSNMFFAGDWISTGWPATMEGAVRGGYLAAQTLLSRPVVVPDLAPAGLMRLFPEHV